MRMIREWPARSGVVAPTFGTGAQARWFIPSRAGDLRRQGSKRGAAIRLASAGMAVEWRTAEQGESSHYKTYVVSRFKKCAFRPRLCCPEPGGEVRKRCIDRPPPE